VLEFENPENPPPAAWRTKMYRILCCLALCLTVANGANAGEAEDPSARDYNISMAGALINDWCERNLQTSKYISIHACNYQMAQLYNLDLSTAQFDECVVIAQGDIVKIADCMQSRFNAWLIQEQIEE
jgi:hypothetical protein